MGLWLIRGGSRGEHEQTFLDDSRVFLTWGGLSRDLSHAKSREQVRSILEDIYPTFSKGRISNNTGQIWGFAHGIQRGDWILMPRKHRASIAVGEITGDYEFHSKGPDPFFHSRKVKWMEEGISRSKFAQDLLYSLGAFMTVCRIQRNDAEERVRAMAKNQWSADDTTSVSRSRSPDTDADLEGTDSDLESATDLERASKDQIARLLLSKFKGHGMAQVVDAILRAQGYATFVSPPGPDKGVDILAAPAPMGFGQPRLCVQVKSGESQVDRPTLDQLIGTMQNVNAQHGLLVAWGGFKGTVTREEATQFFRVRLWDQEDLIQALLENYDRLDEEIRAEVPLKRIWTIAATDDPE